MLWMIRPPVHDQNDCVAVASYAACQQLISWILLAKEECTTLIDHNNKFHCLPIWDKSIPDIQSFPSNTILFPSRLILILCPVSSEVSSLCKVSLSRFCSEESDVAFLGPGFLGENFFTNGPKGMIVSDVIVCKIPRIFHWVDVRIQD